MDGFERSVDTTPCELAIALDAALTPEKIEKKQSD